jgi:hypothetical protein
MSLGITADSNEQQEAETDFFLLKTTVICLQRKFPLPFRSNDRFLMFTLWSQVRRCQLT